jgi:hypothetical protein
MFHTDGRGDGRTDVTKQIVAFSNFLTRLKTTIIPALTRSGKYKFNAFEGRMLRRLYRSNLAEVTGQ